MATTKFHTGSVVPRYDLIPLDALERVAARFELGQRNYRDKAWNAHSAANIVVDAEAIRHRIAHVIHHALILQAKLDGKLVDDGDDDAAAIAWGGMFLASVDLPMPSDEKEDPLDDVHF